MGETVWQFAAGDGVRDYAALCVRFGRAMVGPGSPGPYPDHRDHYLADADDYRPWMESFCSEEMLREGDLLALKRPEGRAFAVDAVGRVQGGYEWLEQFGDVDGWDLQHTRTIEWRIPPNGRAVPVGGLRRGTLSRTVKAAEAIRGLHELWSPRPPENLPPPALPLGDDGLTEALFEHGLPILQCDALVDTLARLRRLAGWYKAQRGVISEHEIRTFLIVPVLQALGWSEQRTKIEFRYIDVALFDEPYRPEEAPAVIVESKRPDTGLGTTVDQARGYAAEYPACRALVVTDGFRYRLFERASHEEVGWRESAYANLLRPLQRHPYKQTVGGAAELFRRLLAPQAPMR